MYALELLLHIKLLPAMLGQRTARQRVKQAFAEQPE